MYKIEMYLAALGIILGIAIGGLITKIYSPGYESCQVLKHENKLLMDMIMRQQETIIIQEQAIPDSLEWYEQ